MSKSDEVRSLLRQRAVDFKEGYIQYGKQLRSPDGEIFVVYDSRKIVVQGKTDRELAVAVGSLTGKPRATSAPLREEPASICKPIADIPLSKRIFIVYGHDQASTDSLELILRRWGLEPIILQNLPASGDTIIEKLEH